MSSEHKPRSTRIFSAKVTPTRPERSRPQSGVTQINLKKQMIESLYGGGPLHTQPSKHSSSKLIVFQATAKTLQNERSLKRIPKNNKHKQELIEENLQLKRTINKLVEELSHQKGKTEAVKKQSHKMSKVLRMEHEKQIYWGSNTTSNHLVTGIKNMYEHLKEKYEEKCAEYDRLIKAPAYTKQSELLTYIDILQNQNKTISQKLQRLSHGSIQIITNNETQRQASEYILSELQNEKLAILGKYKQLQAKFKMAKEGLSDRTKKIAFLEKLIIEKDNNEHAMKKKLKKAEFDYAVTQDKLQEKNEQYNELEIKYLQFQQQSKEAEEKNKQQLQTKYHNILREKDQKIHQLEKQNHYLQNMVKDLRATNTTLNKQFQQNKEKEMHFAQKLIIKTHENSHNLTKEPQNSKSEEPKQHFSNYVGGKRVQRTADQRNSQNSVKKRKIDTREVEEIGQFLRLRFIGLSLSIQEVKDQFSFNAEGAQDAEWEKQYTSMEQVYNTLQGHVFNLDADDALILSRYLIEEASGEHIFCDMINENKRSIVKSILKHLIGDYQIYQQPEWDSYDQFVLRYKSTFSTILQSQSHSLSKKRLTDLMQAHGVTPDPTIKLLLLGKLCSKSKNLSELDCSLLLN